MIETLQAFLYRALIEGDEQAQAIRGPFSTSGCISGS